MKVKTVREEEEINQRARGWIGHTLRRPGDRGSAREGDPDTPGGARECQSWRREGLRGVRQKRLHKIG